MSIALRTPTVTAAPGRRPYLTGAGLVAFLAVAHAATDALTSSIAALLPTLQARFALAESSLALLVATLTIGASIAQPFLGALADRLGRHLVAGAGLILTAVIISLVGIVPSAPMLFALLLVGGLGSAAIHPTGASLARAALAHRSGLAVSLFGAGGTIGVALGPLIVLAVVSGAGLRATPWLMLPGAVLGVLALLFIAPQERCSSDHGCPKLFDARLLAGPVGLLTATEVASSLAYLTFASAVPLWLVGVHGVARDAALIGSTLATFSLAAALGGILAGLLSARVGRRRLVGGSTLLAPIPLLAVFQLEPGSPAYFLAVGLGGGLVNAGLPLKIVTAQELAPRAVATASGMLMGLAMGIAGLLYIGIGALQESIGLVPAASLAYAPLLPAAALAFVVLGRRATSAPSESASVDMPAAVDTSCPCRGGYAAAIEANTPIASGSAWPCPSPWSSTRSWRARSDWCSRRPSACRKTG